MPRHGENIYKRQDGRWEGRYIQCYEINGKAKYLSIYGKTHKEVKALLKIRETNVSFQKQTSVTTMEHLCLEWLNYMKIGIKESTYARYYDLILKHIVPVLSDVKISRLSNNHINTFIKEKSLYGRLDRKGGLSSKTIYDLLSLLKQIIRYAEKKFYISNFDYDIVSPKQQQQELSVLSLLEQKKLVAYIKKDINLCTAGILLSLYTGIRLGELCALQWHDINLESGIIRISKTIQRIKNVDINSKQKTKIIIGKPKSQKSIRTIPLPDFLIECLLLFREKYKSGHYLLSGQSKYVEPRIFQTKFKKCLKRAVIEDKNFHSLRHTFATRAVENGFDIKTLSEILGHSSVRFTLENYVHTSHELKKSNMNKMQIAY
jgi:Site-specific recombinase XerD